MSVAHGECLAEMTVMVVIFFLHAPFWGGPFRAAVCILVFYASMLATMQLDGLAAAAHVACWRARTGRLASVDCGILAIAIHFVIAPCISVPRGSWLLNFAPPFYPWAGGRVSKVSGPRGMLAVMTVMVVTVNLLHLSAWALPAAVFLFIFFIDCLFSRLQAGENNVDGRPGRVCSSGVFMSMHFAVYCVARRESHRHGNIPGH